MAGVPEWPPPAIVETIQHARTWRTPVGRKESAPIADDT
jgi:hypothetical protein